MSLTRKDQRLTAEDTAIWLARQPGTMSGAELFDDRDFRAMLSWEDDRRHGGYPAQRQYILDRRLGLR